MTGKLSRTGSTELAVGESAQPDVKPDPIVGLDAIAAEDLVRTECRCLQDVLGRVVFGRAVLDADALLEPLARNNQPLDELARLVLHVALPRRSPGTVAYDARWVGVLPLREYGLSGMSGTAPA